MNAEEVKILEGPFMYDTSGYGFHAEHYREQDEMVVSANDQDLISIMHCLMKINLYWQMKHYEKCDQNIRKVDEIWSQFETRFFDTTKISVEAIKHIKDTTYYSYYFCTGKRDKANEIYQQINCSRNLKTDVDRSTFDGCKAICLMNIQREFKYDSLDLLKQATEINRNCHLWFFLLHKLEDDLRKYYGCRAPIDPMADNSWLAWCLHLASDSDYMFYYLCSGTALREGGCTDQAREVFSQLYVNMIPDLEITMRLILEIYKMEQIKIALKVVERIKSQFSGSCVPIYFEKLIQSCNGFDAAQEYCLKVRTIKSGYDAELQYAMCQKKFDALFDLLNYLRIMLSKYEAIPEYKQQLMLHIAMQYHSISSYNDACIMFIQAISINMYDLQLRCFRNVTIDDEIINIYDFINTKFMPSCRAPNCYNLYELMNIVNEEATMSNA